MAVAFLVNCTVYFGNLQSMFTVCSGLPENCNLAIYVIICYTYPFFMILVFYLTLAGLCGTLVLSAFIVLPFNLLELRLNRKFYFTGEKLRTAAVLQSEWRIFQNLMLQTNNFIGIVLVPMHTLFVKFIIVCTYMILRHEAGMSNTTKLMCKIWAFMSVTFWGSALLLGGLVHLYGGRVLRSWKYHNWPELTKRERKIFSKFRKSCLPTVIGYGRTYIIRRLSVLKFFRQLSVGLLRTLLALK